MSSSADGDGRSTRKRGRRGKPRKKTSIDDVICEDPFALYLPKGSSAQNGANRDSTSARSIPKADNTTTTNNGGNEMTDTATAGDGCYVSALIQNRRYYGVLFDQNALKAASEKYFHNERQSLELNQRMMTLNKQRKEDEKKQEQDSNADGGEKYGDVSDLESQAKRQNIFRSTDIAPSSSSPEPSFALESDNRTVEKFRLMEESAAVQCYRELIATYANISAAAEDDTEKALMIQNACESGGGFVGKYYYQYESSGTFMNAVATTKTARKNEQSYRLSMGMDVFLRNASLPPWYPLANLECGQSKIMNMLGVKSDRKGGIDWKKTAASSTGRNAMVPMEQRSCFRVGIVGGGIAGLACAHELLRLSRSGGEETLDIEVVLLEAQSRIGGRLKTDYVSFKSSDGSQAVPVDLGASWIHGITDNPLTALSREADVDLITSIEDVKMLGSNMKEVDHSTDKRMGDLFDALLDQGAADCWKREENAFVGKASQKACRWYGSVLDKADGAAQSNGDSSSKAPRKVPARTSPSAHRKSLDITIDNAVGAAMKGREEFERLSDQEHSLLRWYCENAQYALGADMKDLSMMFWDTDETHAFEGDHVILKQGYSSLVEHLLKKCEKYGDSFKLVKNFPAGKLEFARNSTSHPYRDQEGSSIKRIVLSDTCSVTSRDGTSTYNFDFTVCAVPLGVLKDSVDTGGSLPSSSSSSETKPSCNKLIFDPPLPYSKRDAINTVGFGLLNKVYLQFDVAFWRRPGDRSTLQATPFLGKGTEIFGNASGLNPQHYMFLDVGQTLSRDEVDPPAILMTLISGSEAVAAEHMSDEALTGDVLSTLRHLYSDVDVPAPTQVKITRWGSDEFSRGCYTFLPPGTSDQDYHILQSPVNAKGEAFMLDKSETMRLFFCGEHTTSLHPSMAHGAYLSGLRAAVDVMEATKAGVVKVNEAEDRSIPLSVYRQKLPQAPLTCNLCNLPGNRKKEGALLAFQRGGQGPQGQRKVLVHNNCAAFSPEVSLHNGSWENVIKAVNRGKQLPCLFCGNNGATIGCTYGNDKCLQSYHFLCAEDTGWDFERDGKAIFCDDHRLHAPNWPKLRQTSVGHFIQKNPYKAIVCSLCNEGEIDKSRRGDLLCFRQRGKHIMCHSNCLRYTTVVDTVGGDLHTDDGDYHGDDDEQDEEEGREEVQYQNVFEAFESARVCAECGKYGATIQCSVDGCSRPFHFTCAEDTDTGWPFDIRKRKFVCDSHSSGATVNGASTNRSSLLTKPSDVTPAPVSNGVNSVDHTSSSNHTSSAKLPALQHDLFCKGAATVGDESATSSTHRAPRKRNYNKPSNEYVFHATRDSESANILPAKVIEEEELRNNKSGGQDEVENEVEAAPSVYEAVLTRRLTQDPQLLDSSRLGNWCHTKTTAKRAAPSIPWGLQLSVVEYKVERKSNGGSVNGDKDSDTHHIRALEVVRRMDSRSYGLEPGDIVTAINEMKIGSDDLQSFVAVVILMRTSLELRLEVLRRKCVEGVETASPPPEQLQNY